MRHMLNMLEPMTLPSASCVLPLIAATIAVASSGSEVPPATMVSPMTASLTFSARATSVAPPTKRLLPPMRAARPTTIHRPANQPFMGCLPAEASFSSAACGVGWAEVAPLIVRRMKTRKKTKRMVPSRRVMTQSF